VSLTPSEAGLHTVGHDSIGLDMDRIDPTRGS